MSYKFSYRGWANGWKELQSEVATIKRLDTANGTKYFPRYEKGELSIEQISLLRHQQRQYYDIFVEDKEGNPFAFIQINNEAVIVNFLDGAKRKYLIYSFTEVRKGILFLDEAFYFDYHVDTSDVEYQRLQFFFQEDGNVMLRETIDRDEIERRYEGKEPIDVKGLYEKYPEFGEYENILKLERIPLEIMDKYVK